MYKLLLSFDVQMNSYSSEHFLSCSHRPVYDVSRSLVCVGDVKEPTYATIGDSIQLSSRWSKSIPFHSSTSSAKETEVKQEVNMNKFLSWNLRDFKTFFRCSDLWKVVEEHVSYVLNNHPIAMAVYIYEFCKSNPSAAVKIQIGP